MSVRANWHLNVDEAADPAAQVDVQALGTPINLSDPPTLNKKLVAYLEAERVLAERGVTCAVKDAPGTSCTACPIRSTDKADPMTGLCKVGCAEERVLTMLAIRERRPSDAPPLQ